MLLRLSFDDIEEEARERADENAAQQDTPLPDTPAPEGANGNGDDPFEGWPQPA